MFEALSYYIQEYVAFCHMRFISRVEVILAQADFSVHMLN